MPPAVGTLGQVWTATNGSGATAWQTPSASVVTNFIVGSALEVTDGIANYSSLSSAITASSAGYKIVVLTGYPGGENISLSIPLIIEGRGTGSIITGTFTLASGSAGSDISLLQFNGNVTLNSSYNFLWKNWISTTATFTDNGTDNHYLVTTN
jgi:hypothetical protein